MDKNKLSDNAKNRFKPQIDALFQRFQNVGSINYNNQMQLIDNILYNGDMHDSDKISTLLHHASSFGKHIEHLSKEYVTLDNLDKTKSELISLSLNNLRFLHEYSRDSDFFDFSTHSASIKRIFKFCDEAICDLIKSDKIASEDISKALENI